ncbi:4334_t:CDS:2 [Funneliformis caledonium]|uniref:Monothiol glutaredoxin-5, mitochondrial n=1 Tax=Funneliformis caledonium TaxID=1117310 RepID=A0A9N8WG49_9GLOM|nr:4334_t:CDS:2 [Funneliformis caledonium]
MADIPTQLGFNEEETEMFNGMTARERGGFNRLRDDNSRIAYVQALVNKERSWKEKSVCLAKRNIFLLEHFTKTVLAPSPFFNIPFSLGPWSKPSWLWSQRGCPIRYFRHISDSMKKTLDETVHKNDVVLFMKGTPELPECGFSRAVVQIFQVQGVDFSKIKTFNVLKDNELRQGVKEYSQWPTVPQVYIKGEFVGGCDIMLNMHQSGELEELLLKQGLIAEESEKEE